MLRTADGKRLALTSRARQLLSQYKITAKERDELADLYLPFAEAYSIYHTEGYSQQSACKILLGDFRFFGRMMLDMDCTFWAFDWPRLEGIYARAKLASL